jgi:hypothetical protein
MAADMTDVERILHLKFRIPNADTSQLVALVQSAMPFYQATGARTRLLRNVDDPGQFIQVIEYKVPQMLESNRQAIASDPMIQSYLRTWRTMVPGGVEVDVYEDVTGP